MSDGPRVDTAALREALADPALPDDPVDAGAVAPLGAGRVDPVTHELVFSMLLWEAPRDRARRGMEKLCDTFVDCNEMRVCVPTEITAELGTRYPRARDRSERLIGSLRALAAAFPGLELSELRNIDKREARRVLGEIDQLPEFVRSRILLLGLGAHAIPVDGKTGRALAKAGFVRGPWDPDAIATTLERAVRSAESVWFHTKLEHWLDARGTDAKRERREDGGGATPEIVGTRPDPARPRKGGDA